MKQKRLSARNVEKLLAGSTIWDSAVPGLGARRQKSGAVAYVLFYRTKEGRQRWFTIGRHGAPWTPEMARNEARRLLGEVCSGGDPVQKKKTVRSAITITELCDAYMADSETGRLLTRRRLPKKASTIVIDRGRIEGHIKPLLGRHKITAVTRDDVETFMHDVAEGKTARKQKTDKKRGLSIVRGGKGTASRTVALLGGIFTYAIRKGLRSDNPVFGVIKFADGKRDRRLSDDEYAALGKALRISAEVNEWPSVIAATRFLALTGWRRGEVLGLKWSELDLKRRTARLADTKTGASMRPLPKAACEILNGRDRSGELVFPATRGDGMLDGYSDLWKRIAKRGGLPDDVTPHTLRHSFASLAADLGYSEFTIQHLIGHKGHSITSRYVHSADAILLSAADAVAAHTAKLMEGAKQGENVVDMQAARREPDRTNVPPTEGGRAAGDQALV